MELDELKKSWNALDQHLQKDRLVDEDKLSELISTYKSNAGKSIRRLAGWQRLSVSIGIAAILIVVALWCILPRFISGNLKDESCILCLFFAVTIILGIFWDLKTYQWIRDTKVDEMPIVQVALRMNKFRSWMKYEVIAISVWAVLFTCLYYYLVGLYHKPLLFQVIIISLLLLVDVCIIYLVYKKLIYSHLDTIKKNIEELEGLHIAEAPDDNFRA